MAIEGQGEVLELKIESLVPGGEGMARHGGRKVFVPLSAPGDRLRARVSGGGKDWLRAQVVEILEPSPSRREPPCPLFGVCGGCDLMHLSHAAQLEAKEGFLRQALARSGGLSPESLPAAGIKVSSGEELGTRARFQFHGCGGKPGLAKRESRELVAVPSCPVGTPEVNAWLASSPRLPEGGRLTLFGYAGRAFVEGRDAEATCPLGGRELAFSPAAFFQSNPAALERLLLDLADDPGGDALADIYGGVGTLSAFLSPLYRRVTVVEESPASAAFAERNVSGCASLEVQALPVDQWLKLPSSRQAFSSVVCDPPRGGLSAPLRAWLAERRPRRLSYLSCDPVTFARDLGDLSRAGYRVASLSLHDFYPQTSHVESFAVLEAGK